MRPSLDKTPSANVFLGFDSGYSSNGSGNTFVGTAAGALNATGNNNLYLANFGVNPGTESNTIRIGFPYTSDEGYCRPSQPPCGQNIAYIAGVYGVTLSSGVPVYVNADGQLGTSTSSRRFKEQIADMGDSTSRLFRLRPVTFFYKPQYDDGSHLLQYGLIAEEVAKVYPDMVAYDKDGQPYTVKYQYLAPMLLNELQKQHAVVAAQQDVIKAQQKQVNAQQQQIESLEKQNAEFQQRLSRLEWLIAK